MAALDRTTKFFADLDAVLAILATPVTQIAELKLRIDHNRRCTEFLFRCLSGENLNRLPAYSAFDLTEIDAGLSSRLADAEARLAAELEDELAGIELTETICAAVNARRAA